MTSPLRIARPRPADPLSRDLAGALLIESLALPQTLPGDPALAWQVANVSAWTDYLFAPVELAPLPDLALRQGAALAEADLGQGLAGADVAFALAPASDPLPAGLSLSAAGRLAGTPASAATARVVVRAANAAGHVDRAFALSVASSAPQLVAAPPAQSLVQGEAMAELELAPFFQGDDLAFALSPASAPLPAGLSLTAAGRLSGTPTAAAPNVALTLRASNAFGFADASLAIQVRASAPTARGALPDLQLTQGVAMLADLSADFAGEGLSFALAPASAALPAGLSLSAAGVLSGTPSTRAPAAALVVRATNAFGSADSAFEAAVVEGPVAYDYLIDSEARRATVMALPSATLSGKTIAFAPGDYTWVASEWAGRGFTAETRFVSLYPSDRARIVVPPVGGHIWSSPKNITLRQLRIYGEFRIGTSSSTDSLFCLTYDQSNFRVHDCELYSNVGELVATQPPPDSMAQWGWRGFFGSDGSTFIGNGAVFEIVDCEIHGLYRGLNVRIGTAAQRGGRFRLVGNDIHGITCDFGVIAGSTQAGAEVSWNTFHDFLGIPIKEFQVISVDVVNNRMTVAGEVLANKGVGAPLTMNLGASTTTPPGGTNKPGVGGSNDYACTLHSRGAGTTTFQFPVDITSAGSNVFIHPEPMHTDGFQFIPGPGTSPTNYEVIGNRGVFFPSDDGLWPQLIFMEDVSSGTAEGHYVNATVAANVLVGGAANAIFIANPIAALMADNTVLKPADPRAATPNLVLANSWSWGGWGNRIDNNVSGAVGAMTGVEAILDGNHLAGANFGGVGVFTGLDLTVPSTIAGLTDNFQRNDLGGTIDYAGRRYDLPRLNTVVTAAPLVLPSLTEVAQGSTVVAGPVQVTAILNSDGQPALHGAFAAVGGGNAAQYRITADAAGTVVKTAWGTAPTLLAPGDFVWIRQTVGIETAKPHRATLFLGRSRALFQATTVVADALRVAFDANFATNASAGFAALSAATFVYDAAGTELDVTTGGATSGVQTPIFPVVSGRRYRVDVSAVNRSSGLSLDATCATAHSGGTTLASLSAASRIGPGSSGTMSFEFTGSAAATATVRAYLRSGAAGQAFSLKRVLVREMPT